MTSAHLADDIEREEGRKARAYPDPITHGAPWTIGVGHTGMEVHPGLVWTEAQIDAALAHDIQHVCDGYDRALPWWRKLSPERQDVLIQMGFQMGVDGVLAFRQTLAAMKRGDFAAAETGMLQSTWAKQTPDRAKRLATQMLTGQRP